MVTMSLSNADRSSQATPTIHKLMKKLKFLEDQRKNSFNYWQFDESENCSVRKMAEAGFYYSGVSDDDDSATCFVCGKVLDGWENTDEPWKEHEKHAPNCSFVKQHLSEDNMTVGQFIEFASFVIKEHLKVVFNQKMTAVSKRYDEISIALKSQQF